MHQETILAVDDSASIRKFIALALKSKGYRVITAIDGMNALEILSQERVDLVITDLNMPNTDGYELIRALRSNDKFSKLPIIVLSSLESNEDIELALSLGANSYLIKPFNMARIQYELAKYLS